jgi:hypothetical protein
VRHRSASWCGKHMISPLLALPVATGVHLVLNRPFPLPGAATG